MKSYDENSNIGEFLKQMQSIQKLLGLHKALPFLPESKKNWKSRKTQLQHRRQRKICYSYKNHKISLKLWINTKRVHRVIQFNQKAWLKPYIDKDTKVRKEAKN